MTLESSPMPSASLDIDTELYPFVYVRFGARPMEDADVDWMIREFTELVRRRERFVALLDCREMRSPANPKQRKRLAEWQTQPEMYDGTRTYLIGAAVLIRSALVRGATTAVLWMFPPPAPTKLFGEPADAIPWLREQTEAGGIALRAGATEQLLDLASTG